MQKFSFASFSYFVELRYVIYTHGADFSEVWGCNGEFSHISIPNKTI